MKCMHGIEIILTVEMCRHQSIITIEMSHTQRLEGEGEGREGGGRRRETEGMSSQRPAMHAGTEEQMRAMCAEHMSMRCQRWRGWGTLHTSPRSLCDKEDMPLSLRRHIHGLQTVTWDTEATPMAGWRMRGGQRRHERQAMRHATRLFPVIITLLRDRGQTKR